MNKTDNDGAEKQTQSSAFLSPTSHETREAVLERFLRGLVWRSDQVRTILLRDRERTDFDHAADFLDTQSIHELLNLALSDLYSGGDLNKKIILNKGPASEIYVETSGGFKIGSGYGSQPSLAESRMYPQET